MYGVKSLPLFIPLRQVLVSQVHHQGGYLHEAEHVLQQCSKTKTSA
jgi:hypothetical protein